MASPNRKDVGRHTRSDETQTKPAAHDRPATDRDAKKREGYMAPHDTKNPTQGHGDERGRTKDTGRTGA